jgi:hypothetical protein
VTGRHLGGGGHVDTQPGLRLHRAVCSKKVSKKEDCRAASWTVYPAGRYPHRRFHLDVVAQAVATAAYGQDADERPLTWDFVGRRYACTGRTVSRWTSWIAGLTDVEALARTCIRLDPEGLPAAARPQTGDLRARAGHALAAWRAESTQGQRFGAVWSRTAVGTA